MAGRMALAMRQCSSRVHSPAAASGRRGDGASMAAASARIGAIAAKSQSSRPFSLSTSWISSSRSTGIFLQQQALLFFQVQPQQLAPAVRHPARFVQPVRRRQRHVSGGDLLFLQANGSARPMRWPRPAARSGIGTTMSSATSSTSAIHSPCLSCSADLIWKRVVPMQEICSRPGSGAVQSRMRAMVPPSDSVSCLSGTRVSLPSSKGHDAEFFTPGDAALDQVQVAHLKHLQRQTCPVREQDGIEWKKRN